MADIDDVTLDAEDGIFEVEDEEGNIVRFEFVDRLEYNGTVYYALIPVEDDSADDSDEEVGFVVLKETLIDGEEMLATVDDDDEYNTVGEMFLQRFANLPGMDDIDELDELDELDGDE